MNSITQSEKTGMAATLITELALNNMKKKDQIWIALEHLNIEKIGAEKILKIIDSYDQRSFFKKRLKPRLPAATLTEANLVLQKLQDHAPSFSSLPRLRALEGIKTFDLYFGGDHAETIMFEWIEEAIYEDIRDLKWFTQDDQTAQQTDQ